jgi:aminoglycoside phosphotransferase (APT) family kinase protein
MPIFAARRASNRRVRVVEGIHAENVGRFFRKHIDGAQCELTFELLSGGRSNLTYRVRGEGRDWVLRRPPLGHVLPTAHDMAREYRVLSALAETDVPTPQTYALCEDESVNGSPFYVMDYREGVVLDDVLPDGFATTHAERRGISLALVDTLVALHAIDFESVGLGGFGRPDGYLERQVRRWSQQWERSKTDELPAIDELIRRLRAALPVSPPPTIVHGDYRLGNMALDPMHPERVVAIFDWEMATLGDPLADLGYTLIYWAEVDDPGEPGMASPTTLPGFASRAELVEAYANRSGRDTTGVDFYRVLALYKLAVISEGIYARYLQGKTLGKGFEGMTRRSGAIAERAIRIASASGDKRLRGDQ